MASRRSTLQMQQTGLKGGRDFLWGRPEVDGGYAMGRNGSIRVRLDGGDASVPSTSVGSVSTLTRTNAGQDAGRRRDSQFATGLRTNSSREYTIASPPGGVDRLIFELEHNTTDSRADKAAKARDYSSGSYMHRRSSTFDHVRIGHRSSSLCRRNQSLDVDLQQRRRSTLNPSLALGLEAVVERPSHFPAVGGSPPYPPHLLLHTMRPGTAERPDRDVAKGRPTQHTTTTTATSSPLPRALTLSLSSFILTYQILFFTFEAPYLWAAISPALALAAAAMFLLLDALILQLHLLPFSPRYLLLRLAILEILAMAYCSGLSVVKVVKLSQSPDQGSDAAGIHFDRVRSTRSPDGDALEEVLRDMPMSAVLFGCGLVGVVLGVVLGVWLRRRMQRGPKATKEGL